MLDDMFLVLIIFRLLMAAEAPQLDRSTCKKRFSIDCKAQKLKWFHNPRLGICLRKLTCRYGFNYRSDCVRTCISMPKKNQESVKILDMINRILNKYRESERKKKSKATKPSKPATTKINPLPTTSIMTSTILSVTIPKTTTAIVDDPDLETTTYPQEPNVDDSFEKRWSTTTTSTTSSRRTKTLSSTAKKKNTGKVVLGTVKKGIISKIVEWSKKKP